MKSSELHKLNDSVQVDEFTIGGKRGRKTAQVTTDQWKGYKPIKDLNITQIPQYQCLTNRHLSNFLLKKNRNFAI